MPTGFGAYSPPFVQTHIIRITGLQKRHRPEGPGAFTEDTLAVQDIACELRGKGGDGAPYVVRNN